MNAHGRVDPVESVGVSAVIAVGEKAPELKEVLARYAAELALRPAASEIVVVLDGVSDQAFDQACQARPKGANVRVVRLNQPFGESIALRSGFLQAKGDVIISLPAYLQVEPSDVHRLLDAIEGGLDLVVGHRKPRVDPRINRLQSDLFNWFLRRISGVALHDVNSPVRALRRNVFEDVTIQGDMIRFLPIMAHRHGFRVGEVEVRHLRERGKRGFFGVGVYVRRFLDMINLVFLSRFTRAPLRFFGITGIVLLLLGFLVCAYLVGDYLFGSHEALRNRAMVLVGVMLIVLGVQIFSFGLVGEIIIFTQAKSLKEYRLFDEAEESRRARRRPGEEHAEDPARR